jgi:hypothetical protein
MGMYREIKLENGYGRWRWNNAKTIEQITFMHIANPPHDGIER